MNRVIARAAGSVCPAQYTKCYVDGKWLEVTGGKQIVVVDPADTSREVTRVPDCTAHEVDLAVSAARKALPGWRALPVRERASLLRKLADKLEGEAKELAAATVAHMGKSQGDAEADMGDTAYCYRYFADLAEQELGGPSGKSQPVAIPDASYVADVRRVPVGVVGAIVPWNYPYLMSAWKVAPALAAGCTVVLKPSELTPVCGLELARLADEVGLPPGVLNVVTGTGQSAGAPLANHPGLDKVSFTGSVPTGRSIMTAAARGIKNVALELGGKSPILVFDDCDMDAAVEWVLFGIMGNAGQVCSATSRLLVQQTIADRFLERLVAAAGRLRVGPGTDPASEIGPVISRSQYDKIMGMIERARATPGVGVLVGGGRVPGLNPNGLFIQPTIFGPNVPRDSEIWTTEVFGPVLAVRTFATEDEAVAEANDSPFGLGAAVMSADMDRCDRIADALESGIVWINASQPTYLETPWGGMKQSGIGRELGVWGLNAFLETKQVLRYVGAGPPGFFPSVAKL